MNYAEIVVSIEKREYLLVGIVEGISYYTPNDEDLGTIIAVDHTNEIVKQTDFFEMDDIYTGSDYAMVLQDNDLMCRFEIN